MHELVKACSRALSVQDIDTLECLVAEAGRLASEPMVLDMEEMSRAMHVLERQVRAAELHLGIESRVRHGSLAIREKPWGL